MEFANESNFKELIKKRIYYFDEKDGEVTPSDPEINDKCIICDEYFNQKNNSENEEEGLNSNNEFNNLIMSNDEMDINDENNNNNDNNSAGDNNIVKCRHCKSLFHLMCLASSSLGTLLELIPKDVKCIICSRVYSWNEYLK